MLIKVKKAGDFICHKKIQLKSESSTDSANKCLGSYCMAWKFAFESPPLKLGENMSDTQRSKLSNTYGGCGLTHTEDMYVSDM